MSVIIATLTFSLVYTLLGGYIISDAISAFKRGKYFTFGFDIMLAVNMIVCLVEIHW